MYICMYDYVHTVREQKKCPLWHACSTVDLGKTCQACWNSDSCICDNLEISIKMLAINHVRTKRPHTHRTTLCTTANFEVFVDLVETSETTASLLTADGSQVSGKARCQPCYGTTVETRRSMRNMDNPSCGNMWQNLHGNCWFSGSREISALIVLLLLCCSGRAINSYFLHQLEKALHGAWFLPFDTSSHPCAVCPVCHPGMSPKVCRTKPFAGRLECSDFQSREVAGVQNWDGIGWQGITYWTALRRMWKLHETTHP